MLVSKMLNTAALHNAHICLHHREKQIWPTRQDMRLSTHTQSDTVSVASIHSELLSTQQFVHVLHERKLAKAQTQRQGFACPRHFREPHNVVDRLVPYSSKNLQIFDG